MKTVGKISRQYGIPVSTINSAIDAGLLTVEVIDSKRGIDDTSEQFRIWHDARLRQPRIKSETTWIEELATYAAEHQIRIRQKHLPDRYSILEPLSMLFTILDACPDELDFAQAASVGEIQRVIGCTWEAAEEYVSLFYASIGGNQADQYKVNHLLSRQPHIKSTYILFWRNAFKQGSVRKGMANSEDVGGK